MINSLVFIDSYIRDLCLLQSHVDILLCFITETSDIFSFHSYVYELSYVSFIEWCKIGVKLLFFSMMEIKLLDSMSFIDLLLLHHFPCLTCDINKEIKYMDLFWYHLHCLPILMPILYGANNYTCFSNS